MSSVSGFGLFTAVIAGLAGVSEGATFYNVANVDLASTSVAANAEYIGTNPAHVAWDGTDAYVAGWNNGTGAADTAIVKVGNVLTAPTFGTRFGIRTSTNAGRGYYGLDVRQTTTAYDLAATYYNSAAGSQKLFLYEANGAERWNFTPGNPAAGNIPGGPAFDVRVTRVSHMIQGSSTIRNNNITTGVDTGAGSGVNTNNTSAGATTNYRDLDFNDLTGDAWTRENNDVFKSPRASDTAYATTALKAADLTSSNNSGATVQYLAGIDGTDFAIFNDRALATSTQAFTSVVKAVDDTGAPVTLEFLNADGSAAFTAANGAAWYDFSWDADSQTLAVSDFWNRRLYVFATAPVPEPTSLSVVAAGGLLALRRRRRA